MVDTECGGTYTPDDGDLYLFYHGDTLSGCTFYLKTNDIGKKVCAHFEKMDIASCATSIQFYSYKKEKSGRKTRNNFETFTCTTERTTKFCQELSTELNVDIKHEGVKTSDEVLIRFTYEEDNTYIYIVVPFSVIGGVFFTVIVVCIIRAVYHHHKDKSKQIVEEPAVGVFTTLS